MGEHGWLGALPKTPALRTAGALPRQVPPLVEATPESPKLAVLASLAVLAAAGVGAWMTRAQQSGGVPQFGAERGHPEKKSKDETVDGIAREYRPEALRTAMREEMRANAPALSHEDVEEMVSAAFPSNATGVRRRGGRHSAATTQPVRTSAGVETGLLINFSPPSLPASPPARPSTVDGTQSKVHAP